MNAPCLNDLETKVLDENRRVHALESSLYLTRHPEQTNFFQTRILEGAIETICAGLENPQAHILDLGCGTGYLFLKLLARGFKVTGVDLSGELIRVLKERIPRHAESRADLVVADVMEFAGRDGGRYDAVVCSALLHHLYDYESAVKRYIQTLRPGGMFFICFEPLKQAVAPSLRYTLHRGLASTDEALYQLEMKLRNVPLFEEDYHLADYQRRFGGIDPNRLVEIFEAEGLKIIRLEKFCARRFGVAAWTGTRLLRTQNTFNLLARK